MRISFTKPIEPEKYARKTENLSRYITTLKKLKNKTDVMRFHLRKKRASFEKCLKITFTGKLRAIFVVFSREENKMLLMPF